VCVYIYAHTQIRVFHNWVYIKYYLKKKYKFHTDFTENSDFRVGAIDFLIISETPASCNIVLQLFNALLVFLDLSNLLLYFGL